MDGRQLKAHFPQLVTLKLDILQNPGQTASLSQTSLQECLQKNNYIAVDFHTPFGTEFMCYFSDAP
jgi:hypothetical protein